VLDAVTNSVIRACEGEVLELALNGNLDIAAETYFNVIDAKTAALISVCCRVGALAGRAPSPIIDALASFGTHLGRAFQIMDDLMDLVADSPRWGKPLGADLREGRVTLPMIHTLRCANPTDSARLRALLRTPEITPRHVREAVEINHRYGGLEAARHEALKQACVAKAALSVLAPSPAVEALHAIADYAVVRDQ
ncbi:MAG: polyprenyl synthetase family protein, partial [Armatimonadota bacterium]|nr:polyprenyl synthetase family protein [Armatimonadota bacterium]